MKKYLLLFCFFLFISSRVYSQSYFYCLGDSVHLGLASYSGDLQWQESSDSINWNNITGATYQPYGFVFANNKYYRAKVTVPNCNPVYSPVLKAALSTNCSGQYPPGTIHCNGTPTQIVDVTNPVTGRIWMDRNLGASRAAQSSDDSLAYGDLYQWGRGADGHQCRNSSTTTTLSSTDQPGNSSLILPQYFPYDWRVLQNDNLWQGVNGVNNPCPSGYRIPTETELNNERLSWVQAPISSTNTSAGAFASPLKLPLSGSRDYSTLFDVGTNGHYWSSTVSSTNSRFLGFGSSSTDMKPSHRANGLTVRCIKDETPLGNINSIDCNTPINTGTLVQGVVANNVSSTIAYTGGNGGTHNGQTVNSTGVTGLTATLATGNFKTGDSTLTYMISGTPDNYGTASFAINIGGQSCVLNLNVYDSALVNRYPEGSVFCASGPTQL
jgi:uncharacterized protein (TIGR02145 family)